MIMLVEMFLCVSADSPNFSMHVWLSKMRVAPVRLGGSHSIEHMLEAEWARPHLDQVDGAPT